MKLPAEIRIRIYEFVLIEGQHKPVICTWPSSLGCSFETNLCCHGNRVNEGTSTLNLPSLAINKQIYKEACKEFYAKRTFRFNLEQAGQLLQRPELLDRLRRIEIEDRTNQKHILDLDFMMEKLCAAKKLESIIVGTRAVGCDRLSHAMVTWTWNDFLNKPKPTSRIFVEVSEAFSRAPESYIVRLPTLPEVHFVDFRNWTREKEKRVFTQELIECYDMVKTLLPKVLGVSTDLQSVLTHLDPSAPGTGHYGTGHSGTGD